MAQRPPKLQVPRRGRVRPRPPLPPTPRPEAAPGPGRDESSHKYLQWVTALGAVLASVAVIVSAVDNIQEPDRPPVTVVVECRPGPDAPVEPAATSGEETCRVRVK